MTEEDEAFNDIERMSNIRKESVKMTMLKPHWKKQLSCLTR